ncbi:MAG: hypothetical protein KGR26_10185, partial [Cyanobacteria bacterium REEB65]|nr:hypothetical protein [Cyanobacteria bacterium REEB65]
TRTWSVPMALTLPAGTRLLTTGLQLGSGGLATVFSGAPGVAIGIVGTGVDLHADAALSDVTEVGAGIAAMATAPWRGQLDVEAKRALTREGVAGAPISLGAMAGALFAVNANGVPDIGLQVGLPVTKVLSFTRANYVAFTLDPNWNLGALGAQSGKPATGINNLGLGFGVDLALNDVSHFLADTNLGLALGGVQTNAAVGFRYAFNPGFIGQVYLGVGSGGLGGGTSGLGIGTIMQF